MKATQRIQINRDSKVSNFSNLHLQILAVTLTVLTMFSGESNTVRAEHTESNDTACHRLEQTFPNDYAPAEYKKSLFGWNATEQMRKLRENNLSKKSILEYFGALHDLHSRPVFAAGEAVWLGIHIKKTQDGYIIAWIDPQIKTELKLGDQVIKFDGQPIDDAIRETRNTTQWFSTPAFEQSFAERFLTYRASSDYPSLPKKDETITLTVRRKGQKQPLKANLAWLNDAEHPPSISCPLWGKTRNGYLPDLGKIIWENSHSNLYRSYVFTWKGSNYGFIRFHTYKLDATARLQAIRELDEVIAKFNQQKVRAVVLDQTGNAGGHFLFAYSLLSHFIKVPLKPPLQKYLVKSAEIVGFGKISDFEKQSKTLIESARELGTSAAFSKDLLFNNDLNFIPKTNATLRDFQEFIEFFVEDEKRNPSPHLTPPHFQVLKSIEPYSGECFTGPILMLIDELDFSAAEYAAAIMKDNKRAKLLGIHTAGGGGDQRVQKLGSAELEAYTFTITLGERAAANAKLLGPIENVGVPPDIEYHITKRDLISNFKPLAETILSRLPKAQR